VAASKLSRDWGARVNHAVVGLVLFVVGFIGLAVSVLMVARPPSSQIERADGVVVHAGSAARLEAGLALVEAGVAPVLVLSEVAAGYGRTDEDLAALCGRRQPYEVACVQPVPVNTLGEARAFGRLAESRGWRSVAVVTDRGHLTRARVAVGQCTGAQVLPVATDPHMSPGPAHVGEEWLRVVATLTVARAC
jgi:uncharacterized SAM-binding protein YcdF (DUF218 family)